MTNRRTVLRGAVLLAAPALLAGCQGDLNPAFATWKQARKAVFELLFSPPKTLQDSPWTLAQLLQHLAQSIEFSIAGFPEMKPAWFRASLGVAAWTLFNARGAMSHSLDEPIPGAPALDAERSLKSSVQRLLDAMDAFASHQGPLAPHFAYGPLTRDEFERAHLMHLANHWQQLVRAA
ncbi:DUF1569 domain-containing protein [Roseateles sp.]|uniref:DUF1569 domain-containing protein n=1 Tax=Roseateles sp. TaxID=1971397 RepID=UPI00286AFCE8|nr:DUF1569 domain-containing protein [Roseateles sp.]